MFEGVELAATLLAEEVAWLIVETELELDGADEEVEPADDEEADADADADEEANEDEPETEVDEAADVDERSTVALDRVTEA